MNKRDRALLINAYKALLDAKEEDFDAGPWGRVKIRRIKKDEYSAIEPFLRVWYTTTFKLGGECEISIDGRIAWSIFNVITEKGDEYVLVPDKDIDFQLLGKLVRFVANMNVSYEKITGHELDGMTDFERGMSQRKRI